MHELEFKCHASTPLWSDGVIVCPLRKAGIGSWYAPSSGKVRCEPPLCSLKHRGFCVCVCVSKRSWERSGKSASARFASLHTNAAQCQSFIQEHSPLTDSCCNILYDEKEEGGDPLWVSKLISPLLFCLFPGNINWTYLISHSMAFLHRNTYSIKYQPIKLMNGPFWSRAGRFSPLRLLSTKA